MLENELLRRLYENRSQHPCAILKNNLIATKESGEKSAQANNRKRNLYATNSK